VDLLAQWGQRHVAYRPHSGAVPPEGRPAGAWIDRTLRQGYGDCDVVNGLLVLLLQSAAVPARLHFGLVGEGGRARPELHAWAGYFVGGWRQLDLTPVMESASQARPSGQAAPRGPGTASRQAAPARPATVPPGWWVPSLRPGAAAPSGQPAWTGPLRPLLTAGIAILLLSTLLGFAWWHRRKLHLDEPRYLRDLFQHRLTSPGGRDELRLFYRPVFPCLGGRRLSYEELLRLAGQGRLFAARPDSGLAPRLARRARVLDLASPTIQFLQPCLPPVTCLEDVEALLGRSVLPEGWAGLEKALSSRGAKTESLSHRVARMPWVSRMRPFSQRLSPVHLHQTRGTALWREFYLPMRDARSGGHHLLVGDAHPAAAAIDAWLQLPDGKGQSLAVEKLAAPSALLSSLAGQRPANGAGAPNGHPRPSK